jgi:hypothetical protein
MLKRKEIYEHINEHKDYLNLGTIAICFMVVVIRGHVDDKAK